MACSALYNGSYKLKHDIGTTTFELLITSTSGHIETLKFIEPYDDWHSCDPAALLEKPTVSCAAKV